MAVFRPVLPGDHGIDVHELVNSTLPAVLDEVTPEHLDVMDRMILYLHARLQLATDPDVGNQHSAETAIQQMFQQIQHTQQQIQQTQQQMQLDLDALKQQVTAEQIRAVGFRHGAPLARASDIFKLSIGHLATWLEFYGITPESDGKDVSRLVKRLGGS
ncbi:hypothetical protein JCM11251_006930 [Rhodosporidiobolus azoricus]